MKNNNENNGCYTISKAMMNCFKQLLFSKNGDTNLQSIVNDLNFGQNDDLLACSVAFAFKGVKPEIDKATRFEYNWRGYYTYDIMEYSMIHNAYKCVRKSYAYDKETKVFLYKDEEVVVMHAETIDCLDTDLDVAKVRGIEE